VGRFFVQADVVKLHFPVTLEHGRMRVPQDVRISVVPAVDRRPLSRTDASRKPHEAPASKTQPCAHRHGAVRHGAVQVDSRKQKGELAGNQAHEDSDQDFRHDANHSPRGCLRFASWPGRTDDGELLTSRSSTFKHFERSPRNHFRPSRTVSRRADRRRPGQRATFGAPATARTVLCDASSPLYRSQVRARPSGLGQGAGQGEGDLGPGRLDDGRFVDGYRPGRARPG
jgi:hypothetical protein